MSKSHLRKGIFSHDQVTTSSNLTGFITARSSSTSTPQKQKRRSFTPTKLSKSPTPYSQSTHKSLYSDLNPALSRSFDYRQSSKSPGKRSSATSRESSTTNGTKGKNSSKTLTGVSTRGSNNGSYATPNGYAKNINSININIGSINHNSNINGRGGGASSRTRREGDIMQGQGAAQGRENIITTAGHSRIQTMSSIADESSHDGHLDSYCNSGSSSARGYNTDTAMLEKVRLLTTQLHKEKSKNLRLEQEVKSLEELNKYEKNLAQQEIEAIQKQLESQQSYSGYQSSTSSVASFSQSPGGKQELSQSGFTRKNSSPLKSSATGDYERLKREAKLAKFQASSYKECVTSMVGILVDVLEIVLDGSEQTSHSEDYKQLKHIVSDKIQTVSSLVGSEGMEDYLFRIRSWKPADYSSTVSVTECISSRSESQASINSQYSNRGSSVSSKSHSRRISTQSDAAAAAASATGMTNSSNTSFHDSLYEDPSNQSSFNPSILQSLTNSPTNPNRHNRNESLYSAASSSAVTDGGGEDQLNHSTGLSSDIPIRISDQNRPAVGGVDDIDLVKSDAKEGRKRVAVALYSFKAQRLGDLNFKKGDVIFVQEFRRNGWWVGSCNGHIGTFPYNYVEVTDIAK